MYEMKDEYLTGIKMIDAEHRRLFEIAEQAYQLSREEFIPDKYDNIKALLEELRSYTELHFEHEERYMESIEYPELPLQKKMHDSFRGKLEEYDLTDLDENQDGVITDMLTFLVDWLVNHILKMDKRIGMA